jgi:hypothetical protein
MKAKYAIVLFIIGLCFCQFSKIYQDSVDLPGGTSLQTAKTITMTVWDDDLKGKVHEKFPHLSKKQLDGLFIRWRSSQSLIGDKETTVSILFGIQYQGELKDAKAIIEYVKELVENSAEEYFQSLPPDTETNLLYKQQNGVHYA